MKYYLIEPTIDNVGTVRRVFENKSNADFWLEENNDNLVYDGWYVVPEDDLSKLN